MDLSWKIMLARIALAGMITFSLLRFLNALGWM
jgi:hypothetical protein